MQLPNVLHVEEVIIVHSLELFLQLDDAHLVIIVLVE